MAKLKGPLFSLGASQQLGKALVYFNWKGLDVVREYVVPANPNTTAQQTQRAYLREAVAQVHTTQGIAVTPLVALDIVAYALWASVVQSATTWFNQLVRHMVDLRVLGKAPVVFAAGKTTAATDELDVEIYASTGPIPTAGKFWYGISKTALINSFTATVAARKFSATLPTLTTGVKYFWQLRTTAPANNDQGRSGIYYGVPD